MTVVTIGFPADKLHLAGGEAGLGRAAHAALAGLHTLAGPQQEALAAQVREEAAELVLPGQGTPAAAAGN